MEPGCVGPGTGRSLCEAALLLAWTDPGGRNTCRGVHPSGRFEPALSAINEAIEANKNIPDELYFVPRNLGIKAEILSRMGDVKASNALYEKSADLFDALLSKVPTPMVERDLLSDLSIVYAGYFASLSDQGRMAEAFRAIERARGRVEAQALSRHEIVAPHQPTAAELELTSLNLKLLNTDDPNARGRILDSIYTAELQLGTDSQDIDRPPNPVPLTSLQHDLRPSELLVEYVLGEPRSYALAVTVNTVHRYTLPPKIRVGAGSDSVSIRDYTKEDGPVSGAAALQWPAWRHSGSWQET